MHPNPLCNLEVKSNIPLNFLKFAPCVVCLCGFPHNDVVVFVYKHMYHPWCALIHFKQKSKCIDPHCKTNMFIKWFKSFGFREFDKDLLKREISKGYEEYWLQQLNLWRQATFVNCPNVVSMLIIFFLLLHFFENDLFVVEDLKCSSPCKQNLVSIFFSINVFAFCTLKTHRFTISIKY
jgi:hypothetical protein